MFTERLGPARPHAHILENTGDTWHEGHVADSLLSEGRGAEMGHHGIILDNPGNRVQGFLFTDENLQRNWQVFYKCEGGQYDRVSIKVIIDHGKTVGFCIYISKKMVLIPLD